MSRNRFTPISRFISLGAKSGGLAALLWAATLDGNSVFAQQQAQAVQATSEVTPLPAVTDTGIITPVGYLNPDPAARLQELEAAVAQQQAQIQAQQKQVQALVKELHSGGSASGGANAQIPGADTQPNIYPDGNIYPGSAAPAPAILPSSPGPYVVGSDRTFVGGWTNEGPVFTTRNRDFTFHPRTVAQLDMINLQHPPSYIGVPGGNSAGALDAVAFRRLRLGVDGTMWDSIDYVLEFDFAFAEFNTEPNTASQQALGLRATGSTNQFGGTPGVQSGNVITPIQPTTVFLSWKDVPLLGNIRVGNQDDWISLSHIESSRFQDFMERSGLQDAFYGPNNNGYVPGISTFRSYLDQNLNMQLGVYKSSYYTSGFPYDIGNNDYTYGGRVHYTPYYDAASGGRYLVHVGVGVEQRQFNQQLNPNMNGDNMRIRGRGDLRNVPSTLDPNYADTGNFYATGQAIIDPEFAIQWGSLLVQGEYTYAWMENAATQQGGASLGNVRFQGGYVEALYFLTGESRSYQRLSGVFGRTIPNQNGYLVKGAGFGKGAWQVGARYDWLNLNSGGTINGGQFDGMTLGVNWWWNPNARMQFNYAMEHVNNSAALPVGAAIPAGSGVLAGSKFTGEGIINVFGTRLDFSF